MKVLINAYAVSPIKGSEPGLGWNWIIALAKFCELHVITEGEWQEDIERNLNLLGISNVTFYYLPVDDYIRRICWNQGDWRFYYYYRRWEWRAFKLAKQIISTEEIDIVHKLNMGGFREPGYFSRLNKPLVWGPTGGVGSIPVGFAKVFGIRSYLKIGIKNILNHLNWFDPHVLRAKLRAEFIFAANLETYNRLSGDKDDRIVLLNDTATNSLVYSQKRNSKEGPLKLVWSGKNVPRKGLKIALEVMRNLSNDNIQLIVIGIDKNDIEEKYRNLDNVVFTGWISHSEAKAIMSQGDCFLFTSLHEATSTVLVEAMSYGLPVIAHNICGQSTMIDDACGILIPFKSYSYSVKAFTEVVLNLNKDKSQIEEMSIAVAERSKLFTWNKGAEKIYHYYENVIARPGR